MIISHKYKYVFVEVPRTGSTAISAELEKHYAGEQVLHKHAYYSTFLESATAEERGYRVISGIRHPLDDVVSVYRKYKTKDPSYYQKSKRNQRKHAYIQAHSLTFSEFLRKYYRLPYDHWTSTYHMRFDKIIKFESIQEDFADALSFLGIPQVRSLPQKNKTDRKRNYADYYSAADIRLAAGIFGPYMRTWGYEFPAAWDEVKIPRTSTIVYEMLKSPRKLYWNKVRESKNLVGRLFRKHVFN